MKKFSLIKKLVIAGVAALAVVGAGLFTTTHASKYVQSTTPTFFFHGYGSGAHAERHMVNAARKAGVTKTVIHANVDNNGNVTLDGTIPKGAINPIVMVNFEDNRDTNFETDGQYAKNVVQAVNDKYHFKKMNMVAHSMGSMAVSYYELRNSDNKSLPKLDKYASMAGIYNGVNGNYPENQDLTKDGEKPLEMSSQYRELLPLRQHFARAAVLNITGDIGGGTDGTVDNRSSHSLKYLVSPRARSYKEIGFKGVNHTHLHRNAKVDRTLINFLWGK